MREAQAVASGAMKICCCCIVGLACCQAFVQQLPAASSREAADHKFNNQQHMTTLVKWRQHKRSSKSLSRLSATGTTTRTPSLKPSWKNSYSPSKQTTAAPPSVDQENQEAEYAQDMTKDMSRRSPVMATTAPSAADVPSVKGNGVKYFSKSTWRSSRRAANSVASRESANTDVVTSPSAFGVETSAEKRQDNILPSSREVPQEMVTRIGVPFSSSTGAASEVVGREPGRVPVFSGSTTTASTERDVGSSSGKTAPSFEPPLDDVVVTLRQATEALSPLKKKLQENIAEGNVGERGEEWAVAQAAILLCVVLGTVPVVGGALLFLAGPGLLIGGLVVAATGATGLGRSLTPWPAPVDDNELGTTGIYGLVRHPQYSGIVMFTIGFGVVTDSPIRMLLGFFLALLLDRKAEKEEEMLVAKHGQAYENYRKNVAKFIPRFY